MNRPALFILAAAVVTAAAVFGIGLLVGSGARLGSCDCCECCTAYGLYWPAECGCDCDCDPDLRPKHPDGWVAPRFPFK